MKDVLDEYFHTIKSILNDYCVISSDFVSSISILLSLF